MLETSARLLRLLSLLQSRRAWSGSELADELGVTGRTLRRDVDRLRGLGYPVNATSGVAGGYRLGVGASLPPLLLDDDEALAVALGLRSAAAGTVNGVEEAALRALAKLEPLLPPRLRRRVKALHGAIVLPFSGPTIDAELLATLATAVRNHERVAFSYRDGQGNLTRRDVEPHGLAHTGARWYLAAWDGSREAFRTFRVDRIEGRAKEGARFVPREVPDGSVAAYVARSITRETYPHRASIILHAPYDAMRRKLPRWVGALSPLDEDRCRLETGASSIELIATYIGLAGVELEVEDNPELVAQLRILSGRFARAADRSEA
ncbi:MAG: helix-turn-helix transcriptional regulator [Sandaracinaceae bacterium]